MRQIGRALAASCILMILAAPTVLAQTYPPDEPTVEVSDSTVQPCSTIAVTGSNWEAGSSVEITLDGDQLATATAGAGGNVSASVTIPCALAPGTYVLGISGTAEDGSPQTVTTTITVVAAAVGGGGPDTGADVSAGLMIMVGLFVLGVGALVASRRRRRAPSADAAA